MGVIDVSKLIWVNYNNWSKLKGSNPYGNMFFITEKDIDDYIENICKNISIGLDVPYEDLMPIIISYNKDFYDLKKKIYNVFYSISRYNPDFSALIGSFKVPSISYLEPCLELFSYLSKEEKEIFLSKVNID